jgi:cell division protein FtsW
MKGDIASRKRGLRFDGPLCFGVLALVGIGVVLIYSSSGAYAQAHGHSGSYFLAQHVKKVILGFFALLIGLTVPYKIWERWALPLILGSLSLLVLLMGSGMVVHGARRWIQFASVGIQPSELVKIALVFYLARRLTEKGSELHLFRRGLLASLPLALIGFLLILAQPNYSSAATILCITVVMVFVAGCRTSHLLCLGVLVLPAMLGLMFSSHYRLQRLMAFFNPEANPVGSYQSTQALISLGHGGFFGAGLGSSTQKLGYLPMPFTDTVFAILGEELGFIGATVVLLLFSLVVWRGLRVAYRCPDRFGSLAATGLIVAVAVNVFMHVGVCVKMFPTTGQPLPFISYGGTSLIASLFGMGVLLNISGAISLYAPPEPKAARSSARGLSPAEAALFIPRSSAGGIPS